MQEPRMKDNRRPPAPRQATATQRRSWSPLLKRIQPDAAGIDCGATSHYVAVPEDRDPQSVRAFSTFTADLHRLADWLVQCGIKTVAMESTGVYWIPLYEVFEERGLEVVLVNARQVHNVRGRKSDVQDCQWLQELHSVGLLQASFRPAGEIVALRGYALQLIAEIGTDMSRWRTEKHFTAWLTLAPNNKISGGRLLSSKTQPSANRAAAVLRRCAMSLTRSATALGAYYRRLAYRLGQPKAITATARKLAILVYRVLRGEITYQDPGATAYLQLHRTRLINGLRRRAQEFGLILLCQS
jgi:hypothetical protein